MMNNLKLIVKNKKVYFQVPKKQGKETVKTLRRASNNLFRYADGTRPKYMARTQRTLPLTFETLFSPIHFRVLEGSSI
jgi:hypothetical protein